MICVVSLIVFSILGIFSASNRALAKEALDCVFRRFTLRPCNTGFQEKIKSRVLAFLLKRSSRAARIFHRHFEILSWIFFILMVASLFYSVRGIYNYYVYGSCQGLNESGFCAFDPRGENNAVTAINQQCSPNIKNEAGLDFSRADFSSFPEIGQDSKNTIIFIGCYECVYSRKAYPDIRRLAQKRGANLIFAHYPAKEQTNYLSAVDYCVNLKYGDKFWEFNDYLFASESVEKYDREYIDKVLSRFSINSEEIETCVADAKTQSTIESQIRELESTGLYGTPTIFINGKAFVGPKPYRVYNWEIIRPW